MINLIPAEGYWFDEGGIKSIEKKYNAKYMGFFCTKHSSGEWNDNPVDVFYQTNPDTSKGHTNYFGMFGHNKKAYICNAESAFCDPIVGLQFEDGSVIVSRYRHHFCEYQDHFIDGGRDYVRLGGDLDNVKKVVITVKNGQFDIKG